MPQELRKVRRGSDSYREFMPCIVWTVKWPTHCWRATQEWCEVLRFAVVVSIAWMEKSAPEVRAFVNLPRRCPLCLAPHSPSGHPRWCYALLVSPRLSAWLPSLCHVSAPHPRQPFGLHGPLPLTSSNPKTPETFSILNAFPRRHPAQRARVVMPKT